MAGQVQSHLIRSARGEVPSVIVIPNFRTPDDGATFQKLGLIIQAHISRATFHTPPFLGGNVPIGNGPFVLGDASIIFRRSPGSTVTLLRKP